MEKRKVIVRLLNRDYTLVSDQPQERVQRIARYADRTLRDLSNTMRSQEVVPILACVTLSEKLLTAQDENVRLRREIEALRQQAAEQAKPPVEP